MSEKFSIGEIAIYVRPGSPYYGTEVTIVSKLRTYIGGFDRKTGEYCPPGDIGHEIIGVWGDIVFSDLPWLRKKRRDIDAPTTWEEIHKVCGWRPSVTA